MYWLIAVSSNTKPVFLTKYIKTYYAPYVPLRAHVYFLRAYILFTCFRYSYMSSYFLCALIFVKYFSFLCTFLVFIVLHALRFFIFSSQMANKGVKGALIDFFIFSQLLTRVIRALFLILN